MSNKPQHEHDHTTELPSDPALRVTAVQSLLVDKGLVHPETLDALVELYEPEIGPHNGAKVVAKAWTDPEFKQWLLSDATCAIASLGFTGRHGEHMHVVENTAQVHNLIVCPLCSCYPLPPLCLPPEWYKSPP